MVDGATRPPLVDSLTDLPRLGLSRKGRGKQHHGNHSRRLHRLDGNAAGARLAARADA
jgi:hypothetical protein